MSERIEELKRLHLHATPEMKVFMKNCKEAAERRDVNKMVFILSNVKQAITGYHDVIDELFVEIERLTKEVDLCKAGRANEVILRDEVVRQYNELEAGYKAMKEVLEWYAEKDRWETHYGGLREVNFDLGQRARDVLGRKPGGR